MTAGNQSPNATTCSVVVFTTTEEISHVNVLLGLFWLGLLLGSASGGSASSGSGSCSGGTRANVREKLGNVLTLEGLGEESGPVALNGVSASLDDLAEFLFLLTIESPRMVRISLSPLNGSCYLQRFRARRRGGEAQRMCKRVCPFLQL